MDVPAAMRSKLEKYLGAPDYHSNACCCMIMVGKELLAPESSLSPKKFLCLKIYCIE
jgi:hypothetical protein